jgi:hypothetical protein
LHGFHTVDSGSLARADALNADLSIITERSPAEESNPIHLDPGEHAESYVEYLDEIAANAQVNNLK